MTSRVADEEILAPVLVIGSGVAGMVAALAAAPARVVLATRSESLPGGSSLHAQGGVAVALAPGDGPELHARDTIAAAAGLAEAEAVRVLVEEGPRRFHWLMQLGARFDRDSAGRLAAGREGAHSRSRVLHANGDATGAEMVRALASRVESAPHVQLLTGCLATGLLKGDSGNVAGAAFVTRSGRRVVVRARSVVLATGGSGRLFLRTTNPPGALGMGLWLAWRAGAELADLEMVQFHPTALDAGDDPLPLLTEALRGEGAYLLDEAGARFMLADHPRGELAPRDIVARAIWRRLAEGGWVWLDARHLGEELARRFPTVTALAEERGLDPRVDRLPVTPAAHYHMGGVVTDLEGRTSVEGLSACGEVSCSGVHGANRLASNSLLEALVFGWRTGSAAAESPARRMSATLPPAWPDRSPWLEDAQAELVGVVEAARRAMWSRAGVVRRREGLEDTLRELEDLRRRLPAGPSEPRALLETALLVAGSALHRRHSLGAHFREDHPGHPVGAPRHLLVTGERRYWRQALYRERAREGAVS